MIPVRSNGPLPTVIHVFPANRTAAHQDWECPACDLPLGTGPMALVYIGPGDDPETQMRAAEGRWHTGAAVAVHAACAGAKLKETGDA